MENRMHIVHHESSRLDWIKRYSIRNVGINNGQYANEDLGQG